MTNPSFSVARRKSANDNGASLPAARLNRSNACSFVGSGRAWLPAATSATGSNSQMLRKAQRLKGDARQLERSALAGWLCSEASDMRQFPALVLWLQAS